MHGLHGRVLKLTAGREAWKAEFTGANMVMFSSGLFNADACPKPCIRTMIISNMSIF